MIMASCEFVNAFYLECLPERMLRFQASDFGDALRNVINQRFAG